ncbi:MAG TPA: methyltransferase domain-containing protein [Candidatus Dormibacteraeota bacterium]
MSFPYDRLKDGMRWMWSLGDYTSLAERLEPHSQALADACGLEPGTTVLDVAAGNGNLAIAAARRGAIVAATDLTPSMVDLGRARTAGIGAIEWSEADAEQLPFAEGRYDVVASVFGAQFAPRPELVAAEMFRVSKPGGLVAMANYSPGGFLGGLADLMASFSARPAFELPSPFAWGDEDQVRRRFAGLASSIEVQHRTLYFESESVARFIQFWERTNPPLTALKTTLSPELYQQALEKVSRLVRDMNESPQPAVKLSSPYVLVLARKPA